MNGGGTDAATRLGWALRRYWVVVVATTAIFLAIALAASGGQGDDLIGQFESEALIAAADLQIRPEQFPRTASTIFSSGPVEEGTAEVLGLDPAEVDLIGDVIDLVPVEDTVLLEIVGRDADPDRARLLAETAARLMLDELNALGPGFGSFVLVAAAQPAEEITVPGNTSAVVVAVLAGLVFGGGLIGLLIAIRRPVLTAAESGTITGAPVLGTLALASRGPAPPAPAVPGLSAMIKRVLPQRAGIAVFISVKGGSRQRAVVAQLFAAGLARSGPVSLVASGDGPPPPAGMRNLAVSDDARGIARLDDVPIVIDGPSAAALDVPQFLPGNSRVVLVVPEGAAEAAVQEAASQFLEGELAGVIHVLRRRGSRPDAPTVPASIDEVPAAR